MDVNQEEPGRGRKPGWRLRLQRLPRSQLPPGAGVALHAAGSAWGQRHESVALRWPWLYVGGISRRRSRSLLRSGHLLPSMLSGQGLMASSPGRQEQELQERRASVEHRGRRPGARADSWRVFQPYVSLLAGLWGLSLQRLGPSGHRAGRAGAGCTTPRGDSGKDWDAYREQRPGPGLSAPGEQGRLLVPLLSP